jgi:precorrin-6B methylase 2
MMLRRGAAWLLVVSLVAPAGRAVLAQDASQTFVPTVGQPGKDVVWVPTPPEVVEKMLDVAKVTPEDVVVDLGSGDGRNVIAAARRGARGLGIEYNPDMVGLSRRLAAEAGVADRAIFVEGDMFASDFSEATVLALFLLPSNMLQLRSKFLDLRPGTRIVSNTFEIEDWTADHREQMGGECSAWCTVLLYIVPAKVAGTWRLPDGDLMLTQEFQVVSGNLSLGGQVFPVDGRLRGDEISFTAGSHQFVGRVNGDEITGTRRTAERESSWRATRLSE